MKLSEKSKAWVTTMVSAGPRSPASTTWVACRPGQIIAQLRTDILVESALLVCPNLVDYDKEC